MANSYEGKRVVIYARVSTSRQEKNDLSLPDQIATAERWIEEQGATKVCVFSEAGSATDDERRAFREMIALAEADDRPIDIILVHSLSRLFRNALDFMQYRERLRLRKVRIVSITQNFGDDPASDMATSMLALFDAYHSAENGKHVRRTMLANAANGFWNGQTPPWGFRTYVVPQSRGKDRKKLEHDPETVEDVRYAFHTYLNGTADGPVGITGLALHLNERGYRLRGKRFSRGAMLRILIGIKAKRIAFTLRNINADDFLLEFARLLRGFRRQHEDAGTDDRADAQQGQLDRPQRAMQRFLFGRGQDRVERLNAPHKIPPRFDAAPRLLGADASDG